MFNRKIWQYDDEISRISFISPTEIDYNLSMDKFEKLSIADLNNYVNCLNEMIKLALERKDKLILSALESNLKSTNSGPLSFDVKVDYVKSCVKLVE